MQAKTHPSPRKKYKPTAKEAAVLDAQKARRKARSPLPGFKSSYKDVGNKRNVQISYDHEDELTALQLHLEKFATSDHKFYSALIDGLGGLATKNRQLDDQELSRAVAMVAGIGPKDELEAMLATQMAAVHIATMTFASRLQNGVETIQQQDSAERAFNKLARTFTAQIEALRKYRTGGQQHVTVKHVSVNEGGQAIVGSVKHTGQEK